MKKIVLALTSLFLFCGLAAADTLTSRVGMTKPDINSPNWGPKLNKDFDIADSSFAVQGATNNFTATQTFALVYASSLTLTGRSFVPNGTSVAPTYSFTNNNYAGLYYLPSAGSPSMANNGTVMWWTPTATVANADVLPADNSAEYLGSASKLWKALYITGVVGSIDNSDAPAGAVGEASLINVLSGSAVPAMPGNVNFSMATMTVTAGDWDVSACFQVYNGGTSASTVISVGMSTVPGGGPSAGDGGITSTVPMANLQQQGFCTGPKRYRSLSTINVYACGYITYTGATPVIWGSIKARRMR